MNKLTIKPVKGMLDDFPKDMLLYKWIKNKIGTIMENNLFEEYDAPVLESIDIFAAKSSEELIREQSYSFIDKGGRELILRPEMTPSLARLVSQKIKELPKPLRWYSFPKCYRYEQPQKGRIREFRQLNVDLIGEDSIILDLEMIKMIVEIMNDFNVPANAFEIRINNRNIVSEFLRNNNFEDDLLPIFFNLVDKKDKLSIGDFTTNLQKHFNNKQIETIKFYLDADNLSEITSKGSTQNAYAEEFEYLINKTGLCNAVSYSPSTVRGLDYYTGLVFEVYGVKNNIERALFGGGRYDNLISSYVNENVSGIGFGMGVYIFTLFLSELNLLPDPQALSPKKTCLIALLDNKEYPFACCVKEFLKNKGYKTEFFSHSGSFKKLFAKAEKKGFEYLTVIGSDESLNKKIKIKHLQPSNDVNSSDKKIEEVTID